MADLADIATATTAGYKEVVLDRGSGANPATRYEVVLLFCMCSVATWAVEGLDGAVYGAFASRTAATKAGCAR